MSFLERIQSCNQADWSRYLPFYCQERRIGWIRRDRAERLARMPKVFRLDAEAVGLNPELASFEARSAAMARAVKRLQRAGEVKGWRGELYSAAPGFEVPPLFLIERAAIPYFGLSATGVHVNGYVRGAKGLCLWVGRRSRTKQTYPGELDNLVAGGRPHGVAPIDLVVKEAQEEAGLGEAVARRARFAGAISYVHENAEGIKPDRLYVYDLELPEDLRPENRDGEVEAFELWPVERVLETVRDTRQFKFNVNLVIIDFLIRHGLIGREEPDFAELQRGLGRAPQPN
jgi:isopentenyldiphosphate isomerase